MKKIYLILFISMFCGAAWGQTLTISGSVYDAEDKQPIPGVTVLEKGTTNGTITDVDGNFSLDVEQGSTIVFSFVGMETREVRATSEEPMTIEMVSEVSSLDEVVVIGYGTKKKRDIIGSVSSVSSDDMTNKATSSLTSALQGKATGVQISSSSGVPGSKVNIKIRGENSINTSTDPLWVIDGMPIYSGGGLEKTIGSTGQDPMSMINVDDIESVEVLKDAAATSIYGSRGSNGVIIVTTKSGKAGVSDTKIDYSSGITTLYRTPEDIGFTSTSQYLDLVDQARFNSGMTAFEPNEIMKFFKDDPLADLNRYQAEKINTDWFDQILRTGSFQNFNASSSQGYEKGSLYLSVNYNDTKSVLKENYFKRLSTRSNFDFTPVENLKIGSRLNFSYTENTRVSQQASGSIGNSGGGANAGWGNANRSSLPWFPIYNPSHPSGYWNPMSGSNLVANIDPDNHHDVVDQYRGLGNIFMEYDVPFVEGLNIRAEGSVDFILNKSVFWVNEYLREQGSRASERSAVRKSFNYNIYGNYNRTFFDDHNIQATLGAEWQTIDEYRHDLEGQNLTGTYKQIGNPTDYLNMYGGLTYEEYLSGFMGRLNYKFRDKYIVGLSLRRDGSSKFLPATRWETFTAWSAGWILSDEPFFNIDAIDLFKLRGSFGQTGNKDISSNLFYTTFSNDRDDRYGEPTLIPGGSRISNLGVPTLTWETTNSYDVGVDFGLFRNKITGSLAYYLQDVTDLLLKTSLPPSAGVGGLYDNIGDMRNYGVEFNFSSVNIHRPADNFKWSTDFNISTNHNEVMGLTPALDREGRGITKGNGISRTGGRLWAYYMAEFAGVDPDKGVEMIHEIDYEHWEKTGETVKTGRLIPATQTNLQRNRVVLEDKTSVPVISGGFTNNLTYKGFDVNLLFTFSGGHYLYDYTEHRATSVQYGQVVLRDDLIGNTWQQPGDDAKHTQLAWNSQYPWGWDHEMPNPEWTGDPDDPRANGYWVGDATWIENTNPDNGPVPGYWAAQGSEPELVEPEDGESYMEYPDVYAGTSYAYNNESNMYSKYLHKADYIRLQSLEFGYTFPEAFTSRMNLTNVRLYATGSNLWLWSPGYDGWDPETGGGVLPPLKVYSIGLSLNF